MKLWLLRPSESLPEGENPWELWFDKAFGFVIRADTEDEARKLAMTDAGDEVRGEFLNTKTASTTTPWLDSMYSTCIELTADGPAEIIIQDFRSA